MFISAISGSASNIKQNITQVSAGVAEFVTNFSLGGMGTVGYMAPELLSGDKTEIKYNKTVDVYSYGRILFLPTPTNALSFDLTLSLLRYCPLGAVYTTAAIFRYDSLHYTVCSDKGGETLHPRRLPQALSQAHHSLLVIQSEREAHFL
jgi:serine/threonine protein kinase